MIAKYVLSQFYVEITNDERFMNNAQLIAIKNRLGESMNLIKEQGFLEAQFKADLGVPYDECVNWFSKSKAIWTFEVFNQIADWIRRLSKIFWIVRSKKLTRDSTKLKLTATTILRTTTTRAMRTLTRKLMPSLEGRFVRCCILWLKLGLKNNCCAYLNSF